MTDPLVSAQLKFAEMLLWKVSKFLTGFQTDNPMVPFLYFTLERLLLWLLEKVILKETLAKADSGKKLFKINSKDFNIQKHVDRRNLQLSFKLQNIKRKKRIRKAKYTLFVKK